MIVLDRLSFAMNFSRGRIALFEGKYDRAMELLRKAVSSGGVVNRGLRGEAKIFAAICYFRQGDIEEATKIYERGLRDLQESGYYSLDELRYVSSYMKALMYDILSENVPIDIRNVRKSFIRDFPMELTTKYQE